MVHFVRPLFLAVSVLIFLLAGPERGHAHCCPPKPEEPKQSIRTLAQILAAYQKRTKVAIEYLPDGARLASAHTEKGPKGGPEDFLDKLSLEEIKKVIGKAKTVMVTKAEIWEQFDKQDATRRFVGRTPAEWASAENTYYIGSAKGELMVLRRPREKAEEACALIGIGFEFAKTVVERAKSQSLVFHKIMEISQAGASTGRDGASALHQVLMDCLRPSELQNSLAAPQLPPPNSAFDATALSRLDRNLRQILPEVYALPDTEIINCHRSGFTVAVGPAVSAIVLKLLLDPSDVDASNDWEIKRVALDKDGRFVSSFSLEHAWSADFEYQRAFVKAATQPTLKVTGIRSMVEAALKDYLGAKKLAEENSAPAPAIGIVFQPSSTIHLAAAVANEAANKNVVEKQMLLMNAIATAATKLFTFEEVLGHFVSHLLVDASNPEGITSENTRAACMVLVHLLLDPPASHLQLGNEDFRKDGGKVVGVFWSSVLTKNWQNGSLTHVEKNLADIAYKTALSDEASPEADETSAESPRLAEEGGKDKETTISRPAPLAASSTNEDPAFRASMAADSSEKVAAEAMQAASAASQMAATAATAAKEAEKAADPPPPPPPVFASGSDSPHLRGIAVHADVANNSLMVVTPKFDARRALEFMSFLEHLIENYDQGRKMVEISVAIVDMDTTVAEEWGTRFAVASNGHVDDYPAFGVGGFRVPVPAPGKKGSFSEILNPTVGVPQIPTSTVESVALSEGLNVGALLVGSSTQFLATLHALERDGRGQVLSRPSVLTVDNSEAVLAEETKFYLPATGLNTGTLAEIPTGLRIAVTPQIVSLGEESKKRAAVRMRILVKEGTGSNTKKNPAGIAVVDNSQFKTVAVIEQGQSLMVAGRLRHEETSGDERVPILGRIPIVSRAFKNANTSKSRQQRVVLITPSIVDQDTYHSEAAAEAGNLFREPELPIAKPLPSRGK